MSAADDELTTAVPQDTWTAPRWVRLGQLQRRFQIVQLVVLAALFAWGTTIPGFTGLASIKSMLVTAAFLGLAGAGQTLVVLLGGIDFSGPAFMAGGAVLISQLCGGDGWSVWAAIALIIIFSLLFGAVNGYISHRFVVQPLVVTLGMSSIITGALLMWTNGEAAIGQAPTFLAHITAVDGHTFGLGIPPIVVIWALLAVVLGVGLRRTVAGRRLYYTGSNPTAAELALANPRMVWVVTFAISGLLGGLVGILLGGFTGSGSTTVGNPYLFEGLGAVIVGGTAFGARGDYWKTVMGALVLTLLSAVLLARGYSAADQQIIYGVIILAVVAMYTRTPPVRDRI